MSTVEQSEGWDAWIGRTERIEDELAPAQARAAAATLDVEGSSFDVGADLPPLWQWFYFLKTAPQRRLGADGHPERGGFMPPVPLPRRMFAGARLRFHRPLRLGRTATRDGEIRDVTQKVGRSGSLAFVTVGYTYRQEGAVCLDEEQDIVYREPGAAVPAPAPAPWTPLAPGEWGREVRPDPRLLFRFSALTFNAHRIHYDRPYAMQEEGYPGLVVHGPLTAVLLADLVRREAGRELVSFRFRGKAPLFDLAPFRLVGRPNGDAVELRAEGPDGTVALAASAELAT
ncbi:MAG: MaoC family dehydratase N-terminal domain-containing protein [Sandaracinaceae bacterium]